MDIMELGAIGELVGGVAVIASLIFVGAQVRQNTMSLKTANAQSLADTALHFSTLLGSNPQVALTFNRGLAGDTLDPGEQAQFTYLYHAWARSAERRLPLPQWHPGRGIVDRLERNESELSRKPRRRTYVGERPPASTCGVS